jgi:hypothetical protein
MDDVRQARNAAARQNALSEAVMRFIGMLPLAELYPHVELGDSSGRIDVHNAADLQRIAVKVEERVFRMEWLAKNPLRSRYYGDYDSETVTLEVRGLTRFESLVDFRLGDSGLVDFIEYQSEENGLGTIIVVFVTGDKITVSGAESELRWGEPGAAAVS